MTEKEDIFEKAKKQFFADKFNQAFDEWKKKNKGKLIEGTTQKAFASMVKVSEDMIKAYKTGESYPREATLKRIISVLGVPDDYFTMKTDDERYKYSPEFMSDIGENKILPYCDEVGLDPRFLMIVRDLFGESLGDQFPFWTPLIRNPKLLCELNDIYIRPDPVDFWSGSAEMKPDVKMFQIEVKKQDNTDEKKRITLSYSDLLFLRDVQNEVRDYIEFLFLKRKKELLKECEEASKRALTPLKNGGYSINQLKAEDLNEIDRYCDRYVDSKIQIEIRRDKKRRGEDGDDQTS